MSDILEKLLSKMKVVPQEEYLKELAAGAPLICPRVEETPKTFHDNRIGECTMCGARVWYRPYNEVAINKVCFSCWPLLEKSRNA